MDKLIIRNAVVGGTLSDISVENGTIVSVAPTEDMTSRPCDGQIIDAKGKAAIPPFYNTHTHTAMTLLRGFADDMPLFEWLNNHIWPAEKKLDDTDIAAGIRLGIVEMIRSGTVFFNDMYWRSELTAKIAAEMGIRSAVGPVLMGSMDEHELESTFEMISSPAPSALIQYTVSPHAIYTVPGDLLRRCHDIARENGLIFHIHVSETQKEVRDSVSQYGMTPLEYLDSLGVIDEHTVMAHCVWLTDKELKIAADRKAVISHCPCSNMKLSSGIFPIGKALDYGCRVTLGTDGSSSNNNLDMREEAKFASLLAKVATTPETLKADEIFRISTYNGAEAFGINAGKIEPGMAADMLLIDTDDASFVPCYNLTSNWIYSANSSLIDTVICNGKILMRNRKVENEAAIVEEARERSQKLIKKIR